MFKIQEMQEAYKNANVKNVPLKEKRHKLLSQLEDAGVDVEKVYTRMNSINVS